MSETGKRLSLGEAEKLAASIITSIDGEAYVVGSIRRKKPEVGDIEILVHRDATINLDVGAGDMFPGAYETIKGGPSKRTDWKYWQLRHVASGVNIDMFRFDDDNRGSMMVIRTGPAEFSERFVTDLKRYGMCHRGGYIHDVYQDDDDLIHPCGSERVAFYCAQMPWTEPENRF